MQSLTRRSFLRKSALLAISPFASIQLFQRKLSEENQLRITAIEPYILEGRKCFVLVRTSEGITGIGEVSPMNSYTAARLISTAIAPILVDRNPLDIEQCWEEVYYRTYKQGVMGLQPEAIAGVDIALWDIFGKVARLSISQLLGGRRRDTVRVYASIGGGASMKAKDMASLAERAVERGFTAVKVRMDYGPVAPDQNVAHDLNMLREVRRAIGPDIELLYDVNNGYSVNTAIRVGREIESLGVIHYEEPVAQTDYKGYAQVVEALDIPVAAGEHEYTRWQFRDLIEYANPDILQPDLVKCAGISEAVKIATLASTYHKKLVPHQTQPTIGQAANLHFTSVFVTDDLAQELSHDAMQSPLHELFQDPLQFENGYLQVPDGPGLGLTLDENKMRQMIL